MKTDLPNYFAGIKTLEKTAAPLVEAVRPKNQIIWKMRQLRRNRLVRFLRKISSLKAEG